MASRCGNNVLFVVKHTAYFLAPAIWEETFREENVFYCNDTGSVLQCDRCLA